MHYEALKGTDNTFRMRNGSFKAPAAKDMQLPPGQAFSLHGSQYGVVKAPHILEEVLAPGATNQRTADGQVH